MSTTKKKIILLTYMNISMGGGEIEDNQNQRLFMHGAEKDAK